MQDTKKSFMVLSPFIWKPCAIINNPLPNMNKYCSNFTQNKPRHTYNLPTKQGNIPCQDIPKFTEKTGSYLIQISLKSLKKIHNSLILLIIQQQWKA